LAPPEPSHSGTIGCRWLGRGAASEGDLLFGFKGQVIIASAQLIAVSTIIQSWGDYPTKTP